MAADQSPSEDETRYRTLLEFAPESIVVHRNLEIIYINPAGAALLGAPTPESLIGRHLLDFTLPEYHETVRKRMSQLDVTGRQVPLVRQRLRRLDGDVLDIEVASTLFTYDGQPAVLTLARDITERKRLEEELRQAQKMEAVGELTSGLAHDFKNILSVILTTAEFLKESCRNDGGDVQNAIDDVRMAAGRGAEMIQRLMAFSRRAELRLEPLALKDVLRDTHSLLEHLMPDNIPVEIEIGADVGAVQADAAALEQVLLNLANNARDAMPCGGRLKLAATAERLDRVRQTATGPIGPGDTFCVSVSDSGHGMDEATRRKVFEPFFTTKPPGKGTGLGMAMVHGTVKQLGGCIDIESQPGHGTTVRLWLPVATGISRPSAFHVPLKARTPVPARGGGEGVLVVDDEEALLRSSRRVLERLGYRVYTASDGAEGLEILRREGAAISLVVSDTVMPTLDGFDLYRAVKRDLPGLRFVFASGYSQADLSKTGGVPPDVPFIAKPWTLAEFAGKVREVLDSAPDA